ncbi:hypothetical protein GGR50DRAFT_111932 [Xylaria sp. CBS 124048]|nr:hypothetical protein GGR50DRAFT_111932 [Xylaria sp. CBS 124048]
MFSSKILPTISAILVSFTSLAAGQGINTLPCPTSTSNPTFKISDFTGGLLDNDDESFVFWLATSFNLFESGCSGALGSASVDSGMSWCEPRIPYWNASFVLNRDNTISIGNTFPCTLTNGSVVEAHADGSAVLDIGTDENGQFFTDPGVVEIPVTVGMYKGSY